MVLHVRVMTEFGGGPEKTILRSPRFLRRMGYDSVCAYMHPPAEAGAEQLHRSASQLGAEVCSIFDRGPWDYRVLANLIRLCRRKRVTIWHGHDYKSNLFGLIARRFWPMTLVTTVHGWVQQTRRTPLYYAIDRRCLPRYDSVLCVSEDLYQSTLRCGVPSERCHLVHNAIDDKQFRRREPLEAASRSVDGPLVLGAMGRLSEEKGFALLVQAVAELSAEGLACRLKIAGDGNERSKLERLIVQLGCHSAVQLLGHVNDTKLFYESLDGFVLSSLREGLPNVLLEAMSMEVPIVATRIAGIPQLIQSGENGILVEPNGVAELKQGIRLLASDPVKRRQLAEAGRRTIEASYSFHCRMQRVAAIYDGLIGISRMAKGVLQEPPMAKSRQFT